MLPSPVNVDYHEFAARQRQRISEGEEMRRETEELRRQNRERKREEEEKALARTDVAKQTQADAAAWWSAIDARITEHIEQRTQCIVDALGQALGEMVSKEREQMRAEVKAMIDERLVAILVERNPAPPPAALDQKDVDCIIERAVDAMRDHVRERIDDERRALLKLLDAETTARQAAIAAAPVMAGRKDVDQIIDRCCDATRSYVHACVDTAAEKFREMLADEVRIREAAVAVAIKTLRNELKAAIKTAIVPLKSELAIASRSVVRCWSIDRESYALTATMADGSTCTIDLRGLFEQFDAETS